MAMVKVGDRLPEVTLPYQVGDEVMEFDLGAGLAGKKAVIFGMPGAYTATCSAAHLPSLIRTADAFRAKGVDELLVVVVNDVRVCEHWGRTSGATGKGIKILADWNSELTKALGLEFTVPAIGFKDRMQRCALYVEDGVVKVLQMEEKIGACDLTTGETLLEAI
ncbi:redoxin family protein [Silicimonas sp. MF1-12-2]|uniref:redoxin family protein n=1 Tax=Silicimonas sp. MF1-12-2 TaxID=3384793 RepID=UPI0039B3A5C6